MKSIIKHITISAALSAATIISSARDFPSADTSAVFSPAADTTLIALDSTAVTFADAAAPSLDTADSLLSAAAPRDTVAALPDSTAISAQIRGLISKAENFRRNYDFRSAVQACAEAARISRDSTLLTAIEEEMSLSQNGDNMTGYCNQPTVVARQKMPLKDFFLFYPLENGAWRPVPNQLDSLGGDGFSQAMYIPEDCRSLYYSAEDENGIRNIYHTSQKDTVWTEPALLNEQLTSSSNEIYPMLSADGQTLYFASKGLYGMGGYDLYVSTWNKSAREWNIPVNMGLPYSSPADDFLFVNSPDGRYSLFASNRDCGADSVYIYVLEYDPLPVRKAISDPAEIRRIASLRPENDPAKLDNSAAASDEIESGVDTRLYAEKMAKVRNLRDSIYIFGHDIDDARSRITTATGEERQTIAQWIQEREMQLPALQDSLAKAVKELQDVEMEFLMSGVVIDPEKLSREADREVIGATSGYAFSKLSIGEPLEMNVLKPEPSFDYSFMILPEGRFAEDNTLPDGIVYQIQIFTSSSRPTVKDLKGLSPVFVKMSRTLKHTCCAGLFRTYKDVLGNLNKVKKAGFRNAFIVAFLDGEQISVQKAVQMEKK